MVIEGQNDIHTGDACASTVSRRQLE